MRFLIGGLTIVFLYVVFTTLNHQQNTIATLEQAIKVSDSQTDRCLSMVDEYEKMSGEMLDEISRFINE